MASVVIPPWLETKPTDFLQASAEGERLGLERRGQDIGQQEEQARLGMSQAEMAQNAALQQQKLQTARQIASERLGLQTTMAARKFQQQQAYQAAIQSGMDPIQAMMQFGPTMGQSMAGVGQLGLAQAREKMASLPPQFVTDPNDPKRTLGVTYGGQFHPASMPRTSSAPSLGAKARLAAAVEAVKTARLPEDVKAAQDRLDKIADEVDNPDAEDETGDESGDAAAPAQNETDPLGLFNQSQ